MGPVRGASIGLLSGVVMGCAAAPAQGASQGARAEPTHAASPWGGAAENPVFLEAMTLQLTRQLGLDRARPLVMEILVEGEGAPRVRDAVQMFPAEVETLVAGGAWAPADLKEWKWLVMSALNEELHGALPVSLAQSLPLEDSPTRWMAAGLLFDGTDGLRSVVMAGFAHEDPRNRAFTALAVSASGAAEFLPQLQALMDDGEPWARAHGIAALIRFGDARGIERGSQVLTASGESRDGTLSAYLLEVLDRAAPDGDVLAFVEALLPDLEGANRMGALGLLSLHRPSGLADPGDAEELQQALVGAEPFDPSLLRGVRALAGSRSEEDVATLAALVERENTMTVELELAVGLARAGHPTSKELLERAVFGLPWNQALLAAGCARSAYGEGLLLDWLQSAAWTESPEAIRRLGWSMGLWGGAQGVRALETAAKGHQDLGAVLQAAHLGMLSR